MILPFPGFFEREKIPLLTLTHQTQNFIIIRTGNISKHETFTLNEMQGYVSTLTNFRNRAMSTRIFGDTLHVSLMYLSLLHDLFMPLFIEHCPELSNSSILALY